MEHKLPPQSDSDLIVEAARRIETGARFALVTIVKATGSTPRKEGSRMLVDANGKVFGSVGGGSAEKIAVDKSLECLETRQIQRLELDLEDPEHQHTGMICGGRLDLMIEPFGVEPRLHIFGGGHVAEQLSQLACKIGFRVTIYDSRRDWAGAERFPGMDIVLENTEKSASAMQPTAEDFIAVMTHSHAEDYKIAVKLLRKHWFYLGVIGSQRKSLEIKRQLARDGFAEDEIASMTCPIGVEIGSHTPVEIAVSVAAQLVQRRNEWAGKIKS